MQEYYKNSLSNTIKENDREIVNFKLYCSTNKTIVELLIILCSSVISKENLAFCLQFKES